MKVFSHRCGYHLSSEASHQPGPGEVVVMSRHPTAARSGEEKNFYELCVRGLCRLPGPEPAKITARANLTRRYAMAQADLVLSSVDNHIALITVNDPERRNAVTGGMSALLRAAVGRAEADPGVHAVVITGAGKAFCAGADLSALGSAAEEGLLRLYDGFMAVGK